MNRINLKGRGLKLRLFQDLTMVSSKVEICNLALSCIGDKGSVENIDEPSKQTEIVCANGTTFRGRRR